MTTSTTNIQNDIRAAYDIFEASFARGDAAGLAALYTEDGMLLPAGFDMVQGRSGIQDFWQGVMDMGIKKAELTIAEVEQHGDTAVDLGRYILRGKAESVMDQGKYLVIWRRQADRWKLHRDIWNTSRPPQTLA